MAIVIIITTLIIEVNSDLTTYKNILLFLFHSFMGTMNEEATPTTVPSTSDLSQEKTA
jgi:hypothetical protein